MTIPYINLQRDNMNTQIKRSIKFSLTIAVITFVLAAIFSIVSSSLLSKVIWYVGIFIVLFIVLIGIVFDMLGIASTAAEEAPFHAMASEKVPGAKERSEERRVGKEGKERRGNAHREGKNMKVRKQRATAR